MKRTPPDSEELRSVIRAFGRQQAAFSDDLLGFLMDVDLTMAQFRALVTIRRWGRQSGRELARRLGVTPGTLVPLFDRLEEQGYVRRVPDHQDRRLTWLELTPKADRLFLRFRGMGAGRLAAAVSQLVPRDRAELRRLLIRLAEHMEAAAAEKSAPQKVTA